MRIITKKKNLCERFWNLRGLELLLFGIFFFMWYSTVTTLNRESARGSIQCVYSYWIIHRAMICVYKKILYRIFARHFHSLKSFSIQFVEFVFFFYSFSFLFFTFIFITDSRSITRIEFKLKNFQSALTRLTNVIHPDSFWLNIFTTQWRWSIACRTAYMPVHHLHSHTLSVLTDWGNLNIDSNIIFFYCGSVSIEYRVIGWTCICVTFS